MIAARRGQAVHRTKLHGRELVQDGRAAHAFDNDPAAAIKRLKDEAALQARSQCESPYNHNKLAGFLTIGGETDGDGDDTFKCDNNRDDREGAPRNQCYLGIIAVCKLQP